MSFLQPGTEPGLDRTLNALVTLSAIGQRVRIDLDRFARRYWDEAHGLFVDPQAGPERALRTTWLVARADATQSGGSATVAGVPRDRLLAALHARMRPGRGFAWTSHPRAPAEDAATVHAVRLLQVIQPAEAKPLLSAALPPDLCGRLTQHLRARRLVDAGRLAELVLAGGGRCPEADDSALRAAAGEVRRALRRQGFPSFDEVDRAGAIWAVATTGAAATASASAAIGALLATADRAWRAPAPFGVNVHPELAREVADLAARAGVSWKAQPEPARSARRQVLWQGTLPDVSQDDVVYTILGAHALALEAPAAWRAARPGFQRTAVGAGRRLDPRSRLELAMAFAPEAVTARDVRRLARASVQAGTADLRTTAALVGASARLARCDARTLAALGTVMDDRPPRAGAVDEGRELLRLAIAASAAGRCGGSVASRRAGLARRVSGWSRRTALRDPLSSAATLREAWLGAEASCVLTGRAALPAGRLDPHGLVRKLRSFADFDTSTIYAAVRLRRLAAAGCSPGWWRASLPAR